MERARVMMAHDSFRAWRHADVRAAIRRRAVALGFVLLLHALLALLFLSLAPPVFRQKAAEALLFTFIAADAPEEAAEPEPLQEQAAEPVEPEVRTEPVPTLPEPVPPAEPVVVEPPVVPPPEVSSALVAPPPARPPRVYGPPDVSRKPPADSVRVDGSGPNGEPLYAAEWYREPYDNELRGYLSTSRGPGWGLVACRTAANYRVEDCVIVGEYPNGSGIARSVHAAAWQFRVRPPRVGGREQIGEWVRIRIDYGERGAYAR